MPFNRLVSHNLLNYTRFLIAIVGITQDLQFCRCIGRELQS